MTPRALGPSPKRQRRNTSVATDPNKNLLGSVQELHGPVPLTELEMGRDDQCYRDVALRDRAKINSVFMARRFWSLARRERRAYPASGSVRSEPRSQRPKDQAGNAEVIFARSLNPCPSALSAVKWSCLCSRSSCCCRSSASRLNPPLRSLCSLRLNSAFSLQLSAFGLNPCCCRSSAP